MVKCRNLDNIDINKNCFNPVKKYRNKKPLIGFDTETEKGQCFLLGYYGKENNGVLESTDIDEILKLLYNIKFKSTFNFFYNLTYDFQAIIKCLPYENIYELAKYDKTIYNKYELEILPGKCLKISNKTRNYTVKYYDIAQFYNHNSLNNSAKKFS